LTRWDRLQWIKIVLWRLRHRWVLLISQWVK
jgi:hypothetical protein